MTAYMPASARIDWRTPQAVLERVRQVGPIALDPCASRDGSTGAKVELYEEGDEAHWSREVEGAGGGLVYVNPPYGRALLHWMALCGWFAEGGLDIIALVPARTDTRWFPWDAQSICFWKGRLTFEGAIAPAPFPSCLALWSRRRAIVGAFADAFEDAGRIVEP